MCSANKLFYIMTALVGCDIFEGVSTIQTYRMETGCGKEISMLTDGFYQGRLTHDIPATDDKDFWTHGPYTYCETMIESWDDKLMFYFEKFDLPCDIGHLTFYDGNPSNWYSPIPGLGYLCGELVPEEIYTTDTRYLFVEYKGDPQQRGRDTFSLIFTSYKSGECPSYRHMCENGRCIVKDILCNDFKSCGEVSSCPPGLGSAAIVGILIGSIILICVIVTTVILINICRRRQLNSPGQVIVTRQSHAVVNPVYGQL